MCTGLLATGGGGGAGAGAGADARARGLAPTVLAFNRDEDFGRATERAGWRGGVLAGWDTRAGGTWLGVSRLGRLACLTNVREAPGPPPPPAGAPSRGGLPLLYLRGEGASAPGEFLRGLAAGGFGGCALESLAGFNLVCCDLVSGEAALLSNRGPLAGLPQELAPAGRQFVQGFSNGPPGTPEWAKVARGRRKLKALWRPETTADDLLEAVLVDVLGCREKAASKGELPSTGMPEEVEMAMSSIFVEDDPGMCRRNLRCEHYGTRCSTIVVASPSGAVTFHESRREPDGTWVRQRFDFCIEPPGSSAAGRIGF